MLPQNCGLPSILDGPGPFTVFAPSNEAVDSLRDGRLIYLFTAVSSMGRWGCGLGLPGLPHQPPGTDFFPQGLSKLQELVQYHIYNHGQVRGYPIPFVVAPVSKTITGFALSGDLIFLFPSSSLLRVTV